MTAAPARGKQREGHGGAGTGREAAQPRWEWQAGPPPETGGWGSGAGWPEVVACLIRKDHEGAVSHAQAMVQHFEEHESAGNAAAWRERVEILEGMDRSATR